MAGRCANWQCPACNAQEVVFFLHILHHSTAYMLPPFIIEQIRRREQAERRKTEAEQPFLEISKDDPAPPVVTPPSEDERDRGLIVIDL